MIARALVLGLVLLFVPTAADARLRVVFSGQSIQAAVDAANPGDTILVLPGHYTGMPGYDSVVTVRKSGLRLIGSPAAIIEAAGFEYGIMVGEDEPIGAPACPPITVEGFEIHGFTIRNSDDTGLRLSGVDGFRISHGVYRNNDEYGPFPVCSRNGVITRNIVSGSNDAAIYVGDDDNSTNSVVRNNLFYGNSAGLRSFVLPGLPVPLTDNVLIERNWICGNNRENTGSGLVGDVPVGTGVLLIGADNVTVRRNFLVGNGSFGLAAIGNVQAFVDDRIEPFIDNLRVERNLIVGNGQNPDPENLFTPPADVIFLPDVFNPADGSLLLTDPDPSDNCFKNNRIGTDFPEGIVSAFPCP